MTTGVELSGLQIGLAMGAATIISVGPNNLMLLREGLMRGRSALMAWLMFGSYSLLVLLAIAAATASLSIAPGWQQVLLWGGLAALSWFAIQSFRAAFRKGAVDGGAWQQETTSACTRRALTVIWSNPLTYLELLLIPAALAQSMPASTDRLAFATTLLLGCAVCSFGYAYGGAALARIVTNRRSLQAFDLASGVILSVVAAGLALKLTSGQA